jgi:hypothetical protein
MPMSLRFAPHVDGDTLLAKGAAALLCVALGASPSWATPVFTGPTSPYFLDNLEAKRIFVVQGATVVNSFPVAYASPCSGFCESIRPSPMW